MGVSLLLEKKKRKKKEINSLLIFLDICRHEKQQSCSCRTQDEENEIWSRHQSLDIYGAMDYYLKVSILVNFQLKSFLD